MKPPNKSLNRPAPFNARGPNNPVSNRTMSPRYSVQAPVTMAGRGQQIKATLPGSRQIAGSVDMSSAGAGKAYISNLKVDHEHRRRGVASQLIDAAVNTARRQGFNAVSLEARPSDTGITPQALVAMYRRQGFRSVGRSKRGNPLMERKV